MNFRECQIFRPRVFLTAVFCGLLFALSLSSCSNSRDEHLKRGGQYLQKRRFHEAAMQFRVAADLDQKSAEAHWGLARALENLGQFHEAIEQLRRTIELAPENLDAKAKLGNYFLLAQPAQVAEAERLAQDIIARDARFVEGYILRASILSAQKKPASEVIAVLNQAVALEPQRTATYLSLARFYMTRNEAPQAEESIKKGISVDPSAALGYLEYGRFLDYAGRSSEAELQFRWAIEVAPNEIEAREALAEFYSAQRFYDKAEQIYRELVQLDGSSAESRLQLADFYARIGREPDAINVFNEILTDAPAYARARYRLGEIHLDRREYEKAREQAGILLSANDADAEALLLRARVNLQINKAETAVKDLEEILKKKPSQKDALFYMTQARLALGQSDQARAFIGDLEKYHPNFLKTRLLKIQTAFSAGEPEAARRTASELFETVKIARPDAENDAPTLQELSVRALSARGLASLELGRSAEARVDLEQIVRLSPNSSGALVNLAKVFTAEKKLDEARRFYEKALSADAQNFDALNGAVGVLIKQRQTAPAHVKLDQAIELNQEKTDVLAALYYLKAEVFAAENDLAAAESQLQRSIALDENYLPAYAAYASILTARNRLDEAVELYKKTVEKKPSASIYTLLGMLEDARKNASEAEKNYRKALELMPDSPIAANNLAWLLAENRGNLDEALRLAQKSVDRNPASAGFCDTLGWVYYRKGLSAPAAEQLKKAIALDQMDTRKTGKNPNPAYRQRLDTILASAG